MSEHAAPVAARSSLPDGGRFVALDSWRGLAALAVAVHHIHGTVAPISGKLHDNLALAVDFFFVLSGFVIAASYGDRLSKGFSTLRFMLLRYGRVWPLHALLVAIYLLIEIGYALWGAGPLSGREPFTDGRTPAGLIASLLLVQALVFPTQDNWNSQSWSISVEIALYLAAALLWRASGRWAPVIAGLAALAALWCIATETALLWHQVQHGVAGFGLGIACCAVWRRVRPGPKWRPWLTAFELAAFPVLLWFLSRDTPFYLVELLFVLMVLVFACEAGPVSKLLGARPFVWLGTVSYSLYMVHGMVFGRMLDILTVAQDAIGARWVASEIGGVDVILLGPAGSSMLAFAMLLATLLAAWFAWRFVEWPARGWSRRQAARMGVVREEREAPTI